MIIVVMGVSGCGKITVGQGLAAALNWGFSDADEFHSPANVEKMKNGIPLTDADRAPWLASIRAAIEEWGATSRDISSPAPFSKDTIATSWRRTILT